jgi:hypothetical protein
MPIGRIGSSALTTVVSHRQSQSFSSNHTSSAIQAATTRLEITDRTLIASAKSLKSSSVSDSDDDFVQVRPSELKSGFGTVFAQKISAISSSNDRNGSTFGGDARDTQIYCAMSNAERGCALLAGSCRQAASNSDLSSGLVHVHLGGVDRDQQLESSPAGFVAEIVHRQLPSNSSNHSSIWSSANLQLTLPSTSNHSNTPANFQLTLQTTSNHSNISANLQLTLQTTSNHSSTLGHLQLPLPHGWAIFGDAAGKHYYSNSQLKITQYQHPSIGIIQPSVPIIPSGWEKLQDNRGRVYFGNPQLKIVQYENPSFGIVQAPAPMAAHQPPPEAFSYRLITVPHDDFGSFLSSIFV